MLIAPSSLCSVSDGGMMMMMMMTLSGIIWRVVGWSVVLAHRVAHETQMMTLFTLR